MPSKPFFIIVVSLTILTILTSPPLVRPFLQQEPTPIPTSVTPTATSTPTSTPDPFANIPTATPRTDGFVIEVQSLPSPALGELPPTFTPTPVAASMSTSLTMLLPNPTTNETATGLFPAPPEGPAGMPPDRLRITRLALDVQVTPVGMVAGPWAGPGEFVSAAMPSGKMVGWLNTSAPFAQPGNTVLTGRHQAQGLTVFHGLWTLEPGDEIVLYAGNQSRRYIVDEVLILPEQDQPIEVRLANAEYIQPTEDERLTSLRAGRKRVTPTVQWSSHYRSNSDEHLSAIATSSVGPHHRARSRIGYWSGAAIRGADVRSGRTLFSCSGYTHSR